MRKVDKIMSKIAVMGRIIDGTGKAPFEGVVLIDGKKIEKVGLTNEVTIPPKAKTIEVKDGTILPGLIDCHVHLMGERTLDFMKSAFEPSELKAVRAAEDCSKLLEAGFTSVRDVGGLGIYLKRAVEEGEIRGPRILSAFKILSQTAGHGDMHSLPLDIAVRVGFSRLCDGADDCRKAAREQFREGADFIKICTTGGVLSERDLPTSAQFTMDEIRAIVEEAQRVGSFVAAHAEGTQGIKNAIRGGVKTIEHGDFIDDEGIKLMLENGNILVPTFSIGERIISDGEKYKVPSWGIKKMHQLWEVQSTNFKKAKNAGVKIAAGTDFGGGPLTPHGENAQELELLVKEGLTPMEAIMAATKTGAEALNMKEEIGTLEAGKFADLIVVSGDPLSDISILRKTENIKVVIKAGKVEKHLRSKKIIFS